MTSGSLTPCDFGPIADVAPPDFAGRRVFLTGGTGFVGTWLLEYWRVHTRTRPAAFVLTRDPIAFAARCPQLAAESWITLIRGDVRSLDGLPPAIDAIVHGATAASRALNEDQPLEMISVVVDGTRRVLELCGHHRVRRLLFLSSGLAYGTQPATVEAIREAEMGHLDALNPNAAYGNAKHFAEHLCLQHGRAFGFEPCIARMFAFVGPLLPLDAHFAAGNFLRDGLAQSTIRIGGDGTPLRTYLHAAELAHWLWVLLERGRASEAYNVGSDEVVSIREIAEAVALQCGVAVHVSGTPQAGRPPARYVPDIRKARELGLTPMVRLDESIRLTLAWHRRRIEGDSA